MFDLILELSDKWVHSHRHTETMICQNIWGVSSPFANVFLYTDTPMRFCDKPTIAACDHVNHGFNLIEGQYKRECILRKYLQSSEKRSQWILSTEQDSLFEFSTIARFMNSLPLSDQATYMTPVVGAFIVSTRACIERAFTDSQYNKCKEKMYNTKKKYIGKYRGTMYNNDHLIRYCFESNGCSEFKSQTPGVMHILYNKERKIPLNSTWHVIHHSSLSSFPSDLLKNHSTLNANGFRIELTW